MAATVAPVNVSGGAVRLRIGLFHLATNRMTPKNDTKFRTNAAATPATVMTMPASAGPTARERLNSIPLSADAAARSSLGTSSVRIALWLPKTPSALKMQWFRAFVRSWWYHDEL